jgi:hypothetical protein
MRRALIKLQQHLQDCLRYCEKRVRDRWNTQFQGNPLTSVTVRLPF